MLGIIGITTLFATLILTLIVSRLATTALTATGLSLDAARFQARSAFTGTGFTTSEAETVVNHPVRRRIIMLLMLVRSAGLITIFASLVLSFFGGGGEDQMLIRLVWLVLGLSAIALLARSKIVDSYLRRLIAAALRKWTDLDARDYANILKLSGGYMIREMKVHQGDWLVNKTLNDCQLAQEGVIVLGINRSDGKYIGAPRGDSVIRAEDTLLLYGRDKILTDLDHRAAGPGGDEAHRVATEEQQQQLKQQSELEKNNMS